MSIGIFFSYENLVLQLPVNPEELMISSSGNNSSTEVVKLGEITILKAKKLRGVKYECFLPAESTGPYVLTKGKFEPPGTYLSLFKRARDNREPIRFILGNTEIKKGETTYSLTGTFVNFLASVENVEYGYKAGDEDIYYTLELKEYRVFGSKKLVVDKTKNKTKAKSTKTRAKNSSKFAVKDEVTVNGSYWYTAAGANPHGTFKDFEGKISHIKKGAKYPYHITTKSGNYRGWVKASQMKHS